MKQENGEKRPQSMFELREWIRRDIGEMLRLNVYTESILGLRLAGRTAEWTEERQRIRRREALRVALRRCGAGDQQAKAYVLEHIKELMVEKYRLTEAELGALFPIESGRDCFAAMLFCYRRKYGEKALERLFSEYSFLEGELTEERIQSIYRRFPSPRPEFPELLELAAQRIYEEYKGNGVADELMELELDGISGGLSGEPSCLWVMYHGNTVKLPFLPFGSEQEVARICKNICRSNRMGQLSEKKGYLVTELADGSRVSVARPPFSESWAFFIRKFRYGSLLGLPELVEGPGAGQVIRLLHWLVRGNRLLAVTGEQGAGKTTLLAALAGEIPERCNIRVQEMSFELQLRRRYPERNVVSFRETESISGQEALDFSKKTDGAVTILGEVATAPVVRFLVQLSQNASAFTMFTHHARTTGNLIDYLRNALLQEGGFRSEEAARQQAVRAVQFDIHMRKNAEGVRYIERITQIREMEGNTDEQDVVLEDIVRRVGGCYELTGILDRATIEEMKAAMAPEDQTAFMADLERWWGYRGEVLV